MTYTLSLAAALFVAFIVSASSSEPTVDPNVVKAANFAIESRNRMTNSIYLYKVVDILSNSAEIIPPAHVKYTLQVRAAQTNCRNNGSMNPEDCSVADNAQVMICDFVVLAVPGDNTVPQSLLSQDCD
ncbi:cystatin-F [Clarias gariepinus]|uniref:cystatin-F n=1 Tax=Clarias gariepinus TaxID=13013 RepID=UPI00234DEAE9|nr:cystatin-F [Clarias gariepinus]